MGMIRRIALAVVLTGAVIGIAALQQAEGLNMPWWGWALVGWTGLSFVLGLLIGRWLKSVPSTEEERAWRFVHEFVDRYGVADRHPGRLRPVGVRHPAVHDGGRFSRGFTVRKVTALEESARCPVCDQKLPLLGPDGVMVHLLAIHPDTTEARWVMNEVGVLIRHRSG